MSGHDFIGIKRPNPLKSSDTITLDLLEEVDAEAARMLGQ